MELEELHIYSQFGNMNTLCRYLRHMVERTFPVAVWRELSSTTATNVGSDTIFPSRRRTFSELFSLEINISGGGRIAHL
jgi:hypothetical protein